MTIAQAQALKDSGRYGMQGGLLSVAEMVKLWEVLVDYEYRFHYPAYTVLEVGHYMGLSTAVLATIDSRDRNFKVVSIDAHIPDAWVKDSSEETYAANMISDHADGTIQSITMDSRAVRSIYGFDTVFYDGDHGDEQMRFTKVVHNSSNVRLFIFDDRDFPVPVQCCDFLRANGWRDISPPLLRLNGDKTNPGTMTLGVFVR